MIKLLLCLISLSFLGLIFDNVFGHYGYLPLKLFFFSFMTTGRQKEEAKFRFTKEMNDKAIEKLRRLVYCFCLPSIIGQF